MSKNKNRNLKHRESTNLFFTPTRMIFICLGLAFLFYGNSIKNGYSMDDELVTTTDRQPNKLSEQGITGILKIFASHSFQDGKQNYEYRPVSIYSFAIEWSIMGEKSHESRAHFSHFINVLLYAAVGFLLFQLLQVLFQQNSSMISAAIVILFMIHPIHSEVVNNIKNRDEMLSLIFAILAALQAFKWVDYKKAQSIVYMLLFIILSLLSKKSNLPFVVMIPMMLYFFREVEWKKVALILGTLILAKVLFNFEKNFLLDLNESSALRTFSYHENPLYEMGFLDRIPMYFYSNLFYIQKLIVPYPLSFYYGYNSLPLISFSDWQFFLGVILMGCLLIIAILGLKRKSVLSFSILFFFLAIGGVCNLLGPIPGIVGERLAFSASIGFCISIVFLIKKFYPSIFEEKHRVSSAFVIPLLCVLLPSLLFSINRNNAWNSKKGLYLNDVEHQHESAKVNSLLASEYQLEAMKMQKETNFDYQKLMHKVDSAILFYDRSLKIYFDYESNINNKGVMYYMFKNDYIEASKLFKSAISINKNYTEGLINLANSYAKLSECFKSLSSAVSIKREKNPKEFNLESKNYFFSSNLTQALSIVTQFQYNLADLMKIKNDAERKKILFINAQNYETINPLLKKIKFSNQWRDLLNSNQFNGQVLLKKLNDIRVQLYRIENKISTNPNEIYGIAKFKENKYLDSAKNVYARISKIEPENRSIYNIQEKFAILLKDFNWLKSIQLNFIGNFPNDFLGANYVQLGNAHRSLGNINESIKSFNSALLEFQRELKFINKKTNKSESDYQRVSVLNKELIKLPSFINSLKQEISSEGQ